MWRRLGVGYEQWVDVGSFLLSTSATLVLLLQLILLRLFKRTALECTFLHRCRDLEPPSCCRLLPPLGTHELRYHGR